MMLLEKIRKRPLMFDGAMGTMIYQRGVFLNACYDELCLSQPQLILDIHREYVDAGVDVIETNSFGANRIKLAAYGLADQTGAINRAAIQLARQATEQVEERTEIYVAASIGPCTAAGAKTTAGLIPEVEAAFDEQIGAIAGEGADLVVLETFHDLAELRLAARIARGYGLPVLASFVPPASRPDGGGQPEVDFARMLDKDDNVDIIGINCGMGPSEIYYPLQHVLKAVTKPVVVMPNAGSGSQVGGRVLYLNSPEYFTEFAKRYIELGVRGVGGCCGTTPGHLRMAVKAIKSLSGVKEHLRIATIESGSEGSDDSDTHPATAMADKSALGAKLAAGTPVHLVEILPPRSVGGLPAFLERCRRCRDAGIDAINLPDGPRASSRISVIIAAMIAQRDAEVECVPHYCCRDRNLIGMQADLLGGQALGLRNWLFITGDPPKLGDYPDATGVFDVDAIGLCQLARNLNRGFDAAGQPVAPPTAFLAGVGANPVAVDPEREIERYFAKIEAGAEYAITQPVFDTEALLRFLERVQRYPRQIPVIAGCYPLTSLRNAEFMNKHVPGVVVPAAILERMSHCKTKTDGIKTGVEIAREIYERLRDSVQGLQVSAPLGNIDAALQVF